MAELGSFGWMKPRFYHYCGAHLTAIVCQAGGILLVSVVAIACAGLFAGSPDALSVLEGIIAIAAAYGLGALLGILILGRVFYPVVCWLAGAPFAVGDEVTILRGPRKRKTAEVYEVWNSRGQVRLRLSDEERDAVADVFSCYEVLRVKEPNPQGGANGRQPVGSETNSPRKGAWSVVVVILLLAGIGIAVRRYAINKGGSSGVSSD